MKLNGPRIPRNISLFLLPVCASALILALLAFFYDGDNGTSASAAAPATTGTTALITVQGSGEGLNNGDYLSDSAGLNAPHRYFIEVPPGQGHLNVEIFDSDIG